MKITFVGFFILNMVLGQAVAGPAVTGGNLGFSPGGSAKVEIEQTVFSDLKTDQETCLNGTSDEAQTALQLATKKLLRACQYYGFKKITKGPDRWRLQTIVAPSNIQSESLAKDGFTSKFDPVDDDGHVRSKPHLWKFNSIYCEAFSGVKCFSDNQ